MIVNPFILGAPSTAFVNPIGTAPKLIFDAIDGITGAGGSAIATWPDQGTLGQNLTSAGALQPTVGTLNSKPCAVFSGSNNMNTATFSAALAQPNTIFVILQTTNTASQREYLDGDGANRHLMYLTATNVYAAMFAGTVLSSTTAVNNAAAKLVTAQFNGVSSKLFINGGAAVASGAAGAQTLPKLWVGSAYTAGGKFIGNIQFVGVFNALLSSADMTTFGQYIGGRYGVSVANFT